MKTQIGIPEKELSESVKMMTEILATEMVLYIKTLSFHWNINGRSFMELHKVTDKQYRELQEISDEVAERISKLGGTAIGTMKAFLAKSTIKESVSDKPQEEMLAELLDGHNQLSKLIRKHIDKLKDTKDFGTTDFLTKVLEQHEHNAWILRNYLT